MNFKTPKEHAFDMLSAQVKLWIDLSAAETASQKLLVAIRHKNVSLVKFYLEAGVNVNDAPSKDNPPLIVAVQHQSPVIVKMLLDAGANSDVRAGLDEFSALHWVFFRYAVIIGLARTRENHEQLNDLIYISALLHASGLSLDVRDKRHKTPWHEFDIWLSEERRAAVKSELRAKIARADLFRINVSRIRAQSPEDVIALSPVEQEQLKCYQSGQYHYIWPMGVINEALNAMQKHLIFTYLTFIFDSIEKQASKMNVRKSFEAMLVERLSDKDVEFLEQQDLLVCIEEVRKLFSHPSPQNRSVNYPYFGEPADSDWVVFKNDRGKPAFERKGLLDLSAWNDETAPPVTKAAVLNYIVRLIEDKINAIELQAAQKIQQTYRHAKKIGFFSRQASDSSVQSVVLSCQSNTP